MNVSQAVDSNNSLVFSISIDIHCLTQSISNLPSTGTNYLNLSLLCTVLWTQD